MKPEAPLPKRSKPAREALQLFVQRLVRLRKEYPILHRNRFLAGKWSEELGLKDATWVNPSGKEMESHEWSDARARCIGVILDGRAQISGIPKKGGDVTLLLIVNAHHDCAKFRMSKSAGGQGWLEVLNTECMDADKRSKDIRCKFGEIHEVPGRSLILQTYGCL
jgi:glycogen operon protein